MQNVYAPPPLSLHLFGRFEVSRMGQPIRLRSDSDRALLAYLAVESDRAHSRAAIAELLWPDQPHKTANDNLRTTLAQVRKAIGNQEVQPPFIPVQPRVLQFNPASDYQLDVEMFQQIGHAIGLLPESVEAYSEALVEQLRAAVNLYTGRFLEGFSLRHSAAFEAWRESKAELLHRQAMDFLRVLAEHALHGNDLDTALRYAQRQIELMPEHEGAHRMLMRLYAMSGQTARAAVQFETLQRTLAELDAEPAPEIVALHEQIVQGRDGDGWQPLHQTPAEASRATQPQWRPPEFQSGHPLPKSSLPCFGRQRERERIGQLLRHADRRLLTLLGIGGIGKTRLALQAAEDCADAFPDGVCFVSLAAVDGLNALVAATSVALGFSFQEGGDPLVQLLRHLRGRRMLLVLDNFEHLVMHRTFIDQLLAQTDHLKLLVTSRERVGIESEQSLLVGELDYPPPGEERWLESYPAVSLFVYCARLIDPDFQLTAENRRHVAMICQQAAGLPLGVRLAAALTRLHSPRQIAEDLSRHLDFPHKVLPGAPARQRNIGAVFEYSWQRLQTDEQVAMCRLAVFRGGFTWEAAQAVSNTRRATLLALVDKSLVSRNTFERFEIHELIRRQAQQRLEEQPDAIDTRWRHAQYYLAFLQTHASALANDEPTAIQEITQEIENLRAGWLWSLQNVGKTEIGQIATPFEQACIDYVELLGQFFQRCHRYQDALELYERTFAHFSGQERTDGSIASDSFVTAHWLRLWGEALYKSGKMQESRRRLLNALNTLDAPLPQSPAAVATATGMELLRQIAHRLLAGGSWLMAGGEKQKAVATSQRSKPSGENDEAHNKVGLEAARTYERLGQILYFGNQSEQAVYTAVRGLNLAERCGPSPVLARLYANMCLGIATVPLLHKLAELYSRLAINTARGAGDELSLGWTLELVGMYRTGIADWDAGRQSIEQSIEIHERIGNLRQQEEGMAVLAFICQCRGQFDAALDTWRRAFQSAYRRGDRQVQMWSLSGMIENLMIRGREAQLVQTLPDQVRTGAPKAPRRSGSGRCWSRQTASTMKSVIGPPRSVRMDFWRWLLCELVMRGLQWTEHGVRWS